MNKLRQNGDGLKLIASFLRWGAMAVKTGGGSENKTSGSGPKSGRHARTGKP